MGRKAAAIAEGERSVALRPVTVDAVNGACYLHQLVRMNPRFEKLAAS